MTAAHVARQELNGFQGRLIDRDDPEYEAARAIYNAMIDRRPGLIAQCASVEDVRSVVRYARKHNILLAVRGGGHNGAGFGTCDDGIVLDLGGLDGVSVDPAARKVGQVRSWLCAGRGVSVASRATAMTSRR
jgi:FAD/FMN-containing dehydrogenase